MNICPQCQSVYPEDYIFCLNDGTTLKDDENEQETLVPPKVGLGQTVALSPDMLIVCPGCQLANRETSKFCKKCGAALASPNILSENTPFVFPSMPMNPSAPEIKQVEPFSNLNPQSPFSETVAFQTPKFMPAGVGNQTNQFQPATSQSDFQNKFLLAGILVGIIFVGAIVWFVYQPHPLEAKLNRAISNNQLLTPSGDSAFEFYHQLKKDGVDGKILGKYEDRVFPLLTAKPQDILKSVTEPGFTEKRVEEWQDAAKMLEWASEIHPTDMTVAAKSAYCKGRVNYLTDKKVAAIEDWKRAADLDKKWALPLNGIGLIYNEQKNYETAKEWLRKAIEREPDWAIPYNNLGTAFYLQDRLAGAAPYYQKAVQLEPRWARPHAWLGSIATKNYEYQTAVDEFEKVLAPDAIGAGEMNLESIRKQLEKAKANTYSGY